MPPVYRRKALLPLCALSFLAGCGGGGNDPPPPPPANRAPVLTTTALAATEDTTLNAQVVATDADGNALTFTRVNDVQHGTLTISATGAVVYAPTANYAGADTFSVRVSDGVGGEVTGTVNVTVANVNDAPTFTTLTFNVSEDSSLDGNLEPTDIDSTTLTVTRTRDPQHGLLTLTTAGLVHYVPAANYFGTDFFDVQVSDGAGGTATATVTVHVAPQNDAPVLVSSALSVNEDAILTTQLVAEDLEGQSINYTLDDSTVHGQVSVSSIGVLMYRPDANYFGTDTLAVRISDGPQQGASWRITITVNSVNDAPVAADDEFRIAEGAPKTMAVAANDADTEPGTLTVSIVQQPRGGTITVGASNVLTYTPDYDLATPILFTYRLTDGNGAHDDATVRAVFGTFPGLVYLADELIPGRREIFLFDGIRSSRIAPASPFSPEFITRFTISDDGTKLLYVIAGPLYDSFYFKPINAQGPGTKIWENRPVGFPAITRGTRLALNRTGTQAIIEDRYSSDAKNIYVVDTNTRVATLLGGEAPQVTLASIVLFNPLNQNQVVLQGQVGGTFPTNGTESYSAFVASVDNAGQLTQIGANYPQLQGSGSGFGFWFGGAGGRYIYHTEYLPVATPSTKSLLMYDTNSTSESVVFRRPTGTERGLTSLPSTNADGSRILFGFTEPNPTDGDGPAAYYVASPDAPSIATPLSLPYRRAGSSWIPSNGNDAVFLATAQGAGARQEVYSVTVSNPTVLPAKISKSLGANEEVNGIYVARAAQRLLIGYRTAPSSDTQLYSVLVNGTPGSEILLKSDFRANALPGESLDDKGLMFAYTPTENSHPGLRILSTQTPGYSIPVLADSSTLGVIQFRWLPQP